MNPFFRNATTYRLSGEVTIESLRAALPALAFTPGSSVEMQRSGWTAPREGGDLVHLVGGHALIALRTAKKLLPPGVVKLATKERAEQIEQEQGFKPGRKQMREIKEQVTDELLPKAFSTQRDTLVWIDTAGRRLIIDSATGSRCDEVMQMLNKSVDKLGARALQTAESPIAAMTGWLADDEAPAGFTIDQDAELRSNTQAKATVRYLRHAVETDDARRHIAAGKQCTRLALTWADRVSFVLTESMQLKRITPLDVVRESNGDGQDAAERFDADFALMAGEMGRLIDDVVYALGGEKGEQA